MAAAVCLFGVSILFLVNPVYVSGGLMSLRDISLNGRDVKLSKDSPYKSAVCHIADISLVIDSSASVRRKDFTTGLTFLSNFTNNFLVGPNNVRVSVVTYGHKIFDHFGFDYALSNENLTKAILSLKHRGGRSTQTGLAIKYMREKQMVLARPGVKKIAIVLTDGQSQRKAFTASESKKTHASQIAMVAIGVGRATDRKELNGIASENNYVFQVNNYDSLNTIMDQLGTKACEVTTPAPQEQACGMRSPADINFVFDAAYHGGPESAEIIRFIDEVVSQDDMQEGMQVGCITSECESIDGFELDRYRNVSDVKEHLDTYAQSHLSGLVNQLSKKGFTAENGGRTNAKRIAVLFVGGKVPLKEVKEAAYAAAKNDVINYVVNLGGHDDSELLDMAYGSDKKYVLSGESMTDLARQFVNQICEKETLKQE